MAEVPVRPENTWVSAQGQFIGSSGMIFVDQTAADIYFKNYWRTAGPNQRIALVCTSWGMSMLYIQQGTRDGPEQWTPRPLLANVLNVVDHGVQPPSGVHMVPPTILAVQAGSPGLHVVNEELVGGLRLPWHRRVAVTRRKGGRLHYHQHEERNEHKAHIVPAIKDNGVHLTFHTLVYGSQVSNYRRAEKSRA